MLAVYHTVNVADGQGMDVRLNYVIVTATRFVFTAIPHYNQSCHMRFTLPIYLTENRYSDFYWPKMGLQPFKKIAVQCTIILYNIIYYNIRYDIQ